MTHEDEHPGGDPTAGAASTAAAMERAANRRVAGRRSIDRRVMTVIEGMSDAFLAIGPDWRVTYANRQAALLNRTTADALVGRDHWEQWPETRGTEVERQYRRVTAERVPTEFEHEYVYGDRHVWHEVRAFPADDGGLVVFYRDITHQKALEAERVRQAHELANAHDLAMAAETQFRLLVDRVQDYAVFLLDPDGIVTYWGAGAARQKGWSADEAVGLHLRSTYPAGGAEDGTADEHLRHAAAHGEYIGEGTRRRSDGSEFHARVVLTALRRGDRLVGFSEITQDLSLEREREAALAQATAAATAANVAKSQFLANTSHEIRTPLNAIIGYAELLEIGLAGALAPQQAQYVARIQSTSRHLLTLINDILDLSKIEAGEMRPAGTAELVAPVVAEALQLVEPQARGRQLGVVNACATGPAEAFCGDVERVRQILVNLLSNATRFTDPGGRLTVTCGSAAEAPPEVQAAHAGPWSYVRVEDTGVGIRAEHLERIWEAFVQVDAAPTRRVGGSGLGLTISRHLARLMRGDLTVHSEPGLGSTFVLWLPAADPAEVAARARADGPHAAAAHLATPPVSPVVASATLPEQPREALRAISEGLLLEVERIVSTYSARLRVDPATPSAHAARETELADHTVTFLADVAQCLSTVGDGGPEAQAMLRDGSRIQLLIARRHGAQRHRLGWAEAEVRRDVQLLGEELHAAVRRVARAGIGDVEPALAIINHFLDQATEGALAGFHVASEGTDAAGG